jgi:hypothetical protein
MRRITLVTAALVLVLAGTAHAQSGDITATLKPNAPKAGAALHVSVLGTAPELGGALPDALVLDLQRGFVLDLGAVAKRCSRDLALTGDCPAASRIGNGRAVASATGIFLADVPATVDLFLADRVQAGDLASVAMKVTAFNSSRTVVARLIAPPTGPYGYELRAEGFAAVVPKVTGVAFGLKSLTLDVGARRNVTTTVVKRKKVRRNGKLVTVKRKVKKVVRHDLIRNPKTCATGAWSVLVTVNIAGSDRMRAVTAPCAAPS